MKEKILELLNKEDMNNRDVDSIAKDLGITKGNDFVGLVRILNELEESGLIVRSKRNHYFLPNQNNMFVGTLSINKKGFGFVSIEGEDDDVFISPNDLKDAFNKDTVLIEISTTQDGNHRNVHVLRVIKRGQTRVVGVVSKGRKELLVTVDDPKFKDIVHIDSAHSHGAMPGHKVVVEIKKYKPYLKGTIVEVIGHKLDPGVDILSIVHTHEAPITFDKKIYDYIDNIEDEVTSADLENRVDLRKEIIVTIDGDDAKDLDDGISLKKLSNGNYQLGVHIADVSYYVEENSVLDKEAFTRGTSIYLVDRVIPMLPHKLSNGICSLNPHVDRLTISCMMEINPDGEVVNHEILPTVINSTERMTYNDVNAIIDNDQALQLKYSHVLDLFFLMEELANILNEKRFERGAIDFDTNESKVIVDEKGKPVDIVLRERGKSEHFIEEFMLIANETVAQHFKWLDLPFIYRVHEHPKTQKLQQFSTLARTLGYTIKGSLENVYPGELNALIQASKDKPEHQIISTLLLRCMQKARYDEQCLGHFGLADEYYTHFTSPIRRYPDLIVHRLIRKYLFEQKVDNKTLSHYQHLLPEIALQTSTCERKAIDIEREVNDMKVAEYMQDHIGEEYEGIISSIVSFGFFVELANTVEGLVRMEDLTDDYYFFDDKNLILYGQRTGKKFRMSDRVKVKVTGASKEERNVDFNIVGMKPNKRPNKTVIINKKKSNTRNRNKAPRHDGYKGSPQGRFKNKKGKRRNFQK